MRPNHESKSHSWNPTQKAELESYSHCTRSPGLKRNYPNYYKSRKETPRKRQCANKYELQKNARRVRTRSIWVARGTSTQKAAFKPLQVAHGASEPLRVAQGTPCKRQGLNNYESHEDIRRVRTMSLQMTWGTTGKRQSLNHCKSHKDSRTVELQNLSINKKYKGSKIGNIKPYLSRLRVV